MLSATLMLAAVSSSPIYAQGDLASVLTQNKVTVGADGKEVLAPAAKAGPGDVIEYRVTYTNRSTVTVTASFSYTGASPALNASASRVDLTIVAIAGLTLAKSVSATTALPGALITYTITYTNSSASPLSAVAIRDATPAFTTFVAASCGAPPAGLACTVPAAPTTAPAVGAAGGIIWNFAGSLLPGATSAVTFQVQVDN